MIGYLAVIALPDRGKQQEKVVVTVPAMPSDPSQAKPNESPIAKEKPIIPAIQSEEKRPETKAKIEQANVQIVDGKITCPNCGTSQNGNRTVCYKCFCKFFKE